MKDGNLDERGQIAIIEEQIQKALKEVELLIGKKVSMKDAGELEAMEQEIIKSTDRLAGLIVAQKVQQSLDSADLQQEVSQLIKSLPQKMKNQGQREVEIYPSRGESVTIKSSYFSQKGEKKEE